MLTISPFKKIKAFPVRWIWGMTTSKQLGARVGCCKFSCAVAGLCGPKEAVSHWAGTADPDLSSF